MIRQRILLLAIAIGLVASYCGRTNVVDSNQPSLARLTPVAYRAPRSDEDAEAAAKKQYDALDSEFRAAMAEFAKKVTAVKDKQQQRSLLATENPAPEFAKKFLDLAKSHPDTKAAVNSVLFAVGQTKGAQKNEAMVYLLRNYSDKVRLAKMAESFKREVPSPEIENWYLLMCEHASGEATRASVMLDYAKYVSQIPTFGSTLRINPEIAARLSQTQLDYINSQRTSEQTNNVVNALKTIIDELPEVKKGRTTYGELAKRELFDLTRLQVGNEAPDIIGKDLDGIEFQLSHYRGKVVLLDFWGHWCPPCRAMYPHEQMVVRELADLPFVLIGVNSDRDLETARGAVSSENLSWRHFWNGPKGTNGPIANQWNIGDWPSVYLIDAQGVIRFKEPLGQDIYEGLEILMAEMGHEVDLSNVGHNK